MKIHYLFLYALLALSFEQAGCNSLGMAVVDASANSKSLYMYGRVIDQHGLPVANVDVDGNVVFMTGYTSNSVQTHHGKTDENGLFQFTGLHGMSLGISLKKDGYETNNKGYQAPNAEDKSSPTERAIFTMWRLQGAEPMVHTQLDSRVPYDGTLATFDLSNGRRSDTGDLKITLTRNPLQIKRGQDHFEWDVSIEVVGGGLIESHDIYPYEAPEGGYQANFEFGQAKDAPGWTRELDQTFYVHTAKGEYGRVKIDLFTDATRPDTGISIEAWMNPAGSRDLEFDSTKQVKLK